MTDDPFAQDPFSGPTGDFDRIQDQLGRLLLITPTDHLVDLITQYTKKGETSDAIEADVVALDGEDGPEEFDDMRIFQGPLIMSLKKAAKFNKAYPAGDPKTGFPKMILGRLARGEDKTGQLTPNLYGTAADKRPWILTAPTEEDRVLARKWIADQKPSDPFSS